MIANLNLTQIIFNSIFVYKHRKFIKQTTKMKIFFHILENKRFSLMFLSLFFCIIVLIKEFMSCYLKLSFQNKHKKYKYQKDKPINFQQIKRELSPSPNSFLQSILFVINENPSNNNSGLQQNLLKLNEDGLNEYLKRAVFEEHQTIKIKIVQQSKIKADVHDDKSDSFIVPASIQKVRSKSQEFNLQTQKIVVQTDQIQFTQEFLCNSNIEFVQKADQQSRFDWIFQELQNNERRLKQLQIKKRLTNIPSVYQKIQQIIKDK